MYHYNPRTSKPAVVVRLYANQYAVQLLDCVHDIICRIESTNLLKDK